MTTLLSISASYADDGRRIDLEIIHDDAAGTVTFGMSDGDHPPVSMSFPTTANSPTVAAADGVATITLDMTSADSQRFTAAGMLGATFEGTLTSVRIVSRKAGPTGDWTADAPHFEVHLCWALDANRGEQLQLPDGGQLDANAQIVAEVCMGLGMIRQDWPGLSNFEVRADVPGLGLSTGWLPLGVISAPDLTLPELRLDALVEWFADLLDVNLAAWGLPAPTLPDWSLDLPVRLDLPLGIGVTSTRMRLAKGQPPQNHLVVEAEAKGFFLTWNGQTVTDAAGRLTLTYVQGSGYSLVAELFERSWPPDANDPAATLGFALPIDVLSVRAQAWRLSLGLHWDEPASGGPFCFRALVEIGGLEIRAGTRLLYRTDLRLLVLDGSVITNTIAEERFLFDGLQGQQFAAWKQPGKHITAQSFARDLLAPAPADPANDYGLTFLNGAFTQGERAALLWRMSGERLIRALAHDLLGGAPAGAVGSAEETTIYALEWLRGADGSWQIRLDWQGEDKPATFSGAVAPTGQVQDGCIACPDDFAGDLSVSLPSTATPMAIDGQFDRPLTLRLPGLQLEAARPKNQALVLTVSPDGDWSASHLLIFPSPPASTVAAVRAPVLRVRVGLAAGGAGGKGLYDTDTPDGSFLTLTAGPTDPQAALAVRSVGWRKGHAPRFLQVPRAGLPPVVSLIPATLPPEASGAPRCPGPPVALPAPGLVRFDDFDSPGLDNWTFAIRIAAQKQLMRMFGSAAPGGQKVDITINRICEDPGNRRQLQLHVSLKVNLGADTSLDGDTVFLFDLADLSVRVDDDANLSLRVATEPTPAWAAQLRLPGKAGDYWFSADRTVAGLKLTALALKPPADQPPTDLAILSLDLSEGRFLLRAPPEIDLLLRVEIAGAPLAFLVRSFVLGPGGLDVEADLVTDTLKLKNVSSPFALKKARLRIAGGRLDLLEVQGAGTLPAILDFAPVTVGIVLAQDARNTIYVKGLKAELGDRGKPIMSRGTRFRFEIEELDLLYEAGKGAWFEITGSASFRPDPGEYADGLLGELRSVTLSFTRLAVAEDLLEKVSLMAELDAPRRIRLFGVFELEIRSIGLHPKFADFAEPSAAVLIGGQIRFADTGDVVQAEIDFHTLAIGLPRTGSALPQVHAKGLRVVISSSEGFKIGGRVDSLDNGDVKGFSGEGVVQVPGLPELAAAFSFVRVRVPGGAGWVRAWFVAIEASKISYNVGGALPIFLRQVGLGFGYRYTLPLIREFEKKTDPKELIAAMLAALDAHQSLARIDSWEVDANDQARKWTIALEAVISLGTTQPTPFDYKADAERKMRTIFAQFLAVYRSDFTLVAAAKMWFPVSVDDFFENREGMRARPLAQGFIAYSAPQNRLLAHARKSSDPYLGPRDEAPFPMVLKAALDAVDYDVTLLVEPGLVHVELGWPDRLGWQLKVGPLTVRCRGGILMRLQDDLLIYGYHFAAHGELELRGGVDAGVVGLQIEARVAVTYATRLLISANTRKPLASNVYGAIGLDLSVRFSVRAWLRIRLKFVRITIRISFSFSLQLTVLGEIGWAGKGELGFRGRATLSISVFGRSLGIKVDVGFNKSGVDAARDALQKYATSILEPGKTPVFPGLSARKAAPETGNANDGSAPLAPSKDGAEQTASLPQDPVAGAFTTFAGTTASADQPEDFVLALRRGAEDAGGVLHFVWIMPGPATGAFYPPPTLPASGGEQAVVYATLDWTGGLPPDAQVFVRDGDHWTAVANPSQPIKAYPNRIFETDEPNDDGDEPLTLAKLVAGCHVPVVLDEDTDKANLLDGFPANWPDPGLGLRQAVPDVSAERKRDERVFDPASPARTMRRSLDPANAWDRALEQATAPGPDVKASENDTSNDAALGNQALMLQAFHDDLCRIAAETRWNRTAPETASLDQGRPTLFDLGMVLCIRTARGAPLPDWVSRRDVPPQLSVTFNDDYGESRTYRLLPAITADRADLSSNPQVITRSASFFDEEHLAVAWDMDWGAKAPRPAGHDSGGQFLPGDIPAGARRDIEGYIESYDIKVIDARSNAVLHRDRVTHSDTLATQDGKTVALRPRFGFSMPTASLLARGATQGVPRSVIVSVVPNGHSGTQGGTFSFPVDHVPVRTPLPAQEATARLARSKDTWTLSLSWTQPALPEDGSAGATLGWRLVLRPLAEVPLGAYPEAAGDPTDRGRMGATAFDLLDEDIQVALNVKATAGKITLDLPSVTLATRLFDSRGWQLAQDDPAHAAASGFLKGLSAARPGGRAWRLFLRAGPVPAKGDTSGRLPEGPVSSLAAVTLLLDLPDQTPRPLPHFEWPDDLTKLDRVVARRDLVAAAGPVLVPRVKTPGTFEFGHGDDERPLRAVTVTWNMLPSELGKADDFVPAAVAACTVHEWQIDDLTNRDVPVPDQGRGYQVLRRVVPVEAARARETPLTLHETQLWQAQYPLQQKPRAEDGLAWPDWPNIADWPTEQQEQAVLGLDLARRPVNPLLAMVLGAMAAAAKDLRFEVLDAQRIVERDPVSWMNATAPAVDAYGWAALSGLGLSVAIAARDPVTGDLVDQGRLADLFRAVHDMLAPDMRRHLMADLPVQHAQAYRATADKAGAADIGLAMIQISLRPVRQAGVTTLPETWVSLVARALARAEPGAVDIEAAHAADRARLEPLVRATDLSRYAAWAERFLLLAPDPTNDLPGHLAAAQLRSSDPMLIAPDAAGTLRLTHLVNVEWAAQRRYAVTREGRYDRLLATLATVPDPAARSVDVYLPRIRKVNPPAVLHLGLWQAPDGRPFHDVVVAHAERTLSDRNRTVQIRLEFGEIARSYDRVLAEAGFVRNLEGPTPEDAATNLLAGPRLAGAETLIGPVTGAAMVDPASVEDRVLDAAPAARWGALRFRDGAEPFYYRQHVTLLATAGEAAPAMTEPLALPQQPAGPLVPLDAAPTSSWNPIADLCFPSPGAGFAWNDDDEAARKALVALWEVAVGPMVRPWFKSDLYALSVRMPRYAESLSVALRKGPFAHETHRYQANGVDCAPAGLLPDAEARVLVLRRDAGSATVEPLVQITPVRTSPDKAAAAAQPVPRAFLAQSVSPRVAFDTPSVGPAAGSDWTDGLWVRGVMRPVQPDAFVQTGVQGLSEILALADADAGATLKPGALPSSGPLLCLAPLAVRLVVRPIDLTKEWVGLLTPPAAPVRGILRPHLWTDDPNDPGFAALAGADDLAVAVRLLLDPRRRQVLERIGASIESEGARQFMREIEEAEVFWDTQPLNAWPQAIDTHDLADLARRGLRVWARIDTRFVCLSDSAPPIPQELDRTKPVCVLVRNLASAPGGSDWTADDLVAWLATGAMPPELHGPDPGRDLALRQLALRIAQGAYRPVPLDPPLIEVLRGNLPPQTWGTGGST